MKKRTSTTFLSVALTLFALEMLGIGHVIRVYREYSIPDKETLLHAKDTGLFLEDKNGKQFFTFNTPARYTFIPLSDIPPIIQQAVLASEDRDFYSHGALSFSGIVRAIIQDVQTRSLKYGGSTITQQVVKNTMLSPEKSFSRKYREMILAFKLEKTFSKQTILELYLNTAYFGQNAFGIESASQTYYGKHAKELTVGESATLAGLLPAPSNLTPTRGISATLAERKQSLLTYMASKKQISTQRIPEYMNDYGTIIPRKDQNTGAPYFAIMVRDQLIEQLGEEVVLRGGLHVTTTLDPELQTRVEEILQAEQARLLRFSAHNASAVVIDVESREVRALAGNISWENGKYGKINMALAPRQPGSSFKPIVYATALEQNVITPASILQDTPTTYTIDKDKTYTPQDYSLRFLGPVTARFALSNSLNAPAVAVLHMTGGDSVVAKAQGMGITSLPENAKNNLSLALGAHEISLYEMTNAFAVFADHGIYKTPKTVLEIRDKFGKALPLITPQQRLAVSEGVASLITSILSDEQTRSHTFGSLLAYRLPVALKTGTSSDYKDGWTLGYSNTTAVGIWVGNSDNTPMVNAPAVLADAPIWKKVFDIATANIPQSPLYQSHEVVPAVRCSEGESTNRSKQPELFLRTNIAPGYCVSSTGK